MMFQLFPLLLLITALGSALWYQKTNNDIFGVLAVFSAIIGLICGLVFVHWSINLLALFFLIKLKSPIFPSLEVDLSK